MTWIKIDDTLPNNPKILPLSDGAFRLYIEGLCYANQYLTDGFLTNAVVRRLDINSAQAELVSAELWDVVDNGIQIHDYCEHQTSKADVEAKRDQSRQRLVKHRKAKSSGLPFTEQDVLDKWGTDCHICGEPIDLNAPRHSKSAGWKHGLHLDHVIPVTKGGENSLENVKPAHAVCNLSKNNSVGNAFLSSPEYRIQNTETEVTTSSNKFDEFWVVYPRKVGKQDAQRAYTRALKIATSEEIFEGAKRYASDPNRVDQFTAHPATWLNRGSWGDQPLPPRTPQNGSRAVITTPTVVPPRYTSEEAPQGAPMPESVRALLGRIGDLRE